MLMTSARGSLAFPSLILPILIVCPSLFSSSLSFRLQHRDNILLTESCLKNFSTIKSMLSIFARGLLRNSNLSFQNSKMAVRSSCCDFLLSAILAVMLLIQNLQRRAFYLKSLVSCSARRRAVGSLNRCILGLICCKYTKQNSSNQHFIRNSLALLTKIRPFILHQLQLYTNRSAQVLIAAAHLPQPTYKRQKSFYQTDSSILSASSLSASSTSTRLAYSSQLLVLVIMIFLVIKHLQGFALRQQIRQSSSVNSFSSDLRLTGCFLLGKVTSLRYSCHGQI